MAFTTSYVRTHNARTMGLAIAPLVGGWPVDPSVWHVHSPVEKCAEMHRSLQDEGDKQ